MRWTRLASCADWLGGGERVVKIQWVTLTGQPPWNRWWGSKWSMLEVTKPLQWSRRERYIFIRVWRRDSKEFCFVMRGRIYTFNIIYRWKIYLSNLMAYIVLVIILVKNMAAAALLSIYTSVYISTKK